VPPATWERTCCVAKRHGALGRHVVVVLNSDESVSADEMIASWRDRLAEYKVPRSVSCSQSLPRTAIGKVASGELAETVAYQRLNAARRDDVCTTPPRSFRTSPTDLL
jgi:acyl-CoA synthetase (AMP-forming)/AMP-acid ligase II